jgi:hypothetical protein
MVDAMVGGNAMPEVPITPASGSFSAEPDISEPEPEVVHQGQISSVNVASMKEDIEELRN